MIPHGNHVARLCGGSLAPDGVPQAGAFAPNPGTDSRPPDEGLSVYWLELLNHDGSLSEKVESLRKFVIESPLGERKPGKTAVWAVIPASRLNGIVDEQTGASFECRHAPRKDPRLVDEFDPHGEIHTTPEILSWSEDQAWRLAVQQFICDQIVHVERAHLT